MAGDKVWDWTPQTEFFYAKLGEIITKFQDVPESNSSTPQVTQSAGVNKKLDESNLDLPF